MSLLAALLDAAGLSPANVAPQSKAGQFFKAHGVHADAELERIRALRRCPPIDVELYRARLSTLLREAGGTQELFDCQVTALVHLSAFRRLCLFSNVGTGKLLVGALAPKILGSTRNLFVTYAQLLAKSEREIDAAQRCWGTRSEDFTFVSAERLVRSQILSKPWDLIVVDEAHLFKPGSGRSKAFKRYALDHPETSIVLLTGTPGDDDVRKLAFLSELVHQKESPYPIKYHSLDQWHRALSVDVEHELKLRPGALSVFADGSDELEQVRVGVGNWAANTNAHVVYRPENTLGCSLYLTSHTLSLHQKHVIDAYETAKKHDEVDGYLFAELPAERWRILRQIGLGYAEFIDPAPPTEWKEARADWAAVCRAFLGDKHLGLDEPMQVAAAIDTGKISDGGALERWRQIKKTHVIEHRAVWFDRSVVQWVADWVDKEQGLVWTPYPLFGTEVAALAGVPFFHSLGISKAYGSIETYSAKTGAVVSIQSNLVGRNLQDRWSKALIVAPPSKSDDLNQIIGRLHRTGQRAECVEVKFLFTCAQHLQAVQKSRARAEFDRSLGGNQGNKLLNCDWLVDTTSPKGAMWRD